MTTTTDSSSPPLDPLKAVTPAAPRLRQWLAPTAVWRLIDLLALWIIAPYLLLALHARASADDFAFAVKVKSFGIAGAQKAWYLEWTGRYFSTFVNSVIGGSPALLKAYVVVPSLLFTTSVLSVWHLLRAVARLGAHSSIAESTYLFRTAVLIFGLYLVSITTPSQAFFWMSGGTTYQLGNAIYFCLWGVLLNLRITDAMRQTIAKTIVASALALAAVGSSESLMVFTSATVGAMTAWQCWTRRGKSWPWLVVLAACVIGSLVVVRARGNALREAASPGGHRLLPSVAWAIAQTIYFIAGWILNPALVAATPAVLAVLYPVRRVFLHTWSPAVRAILFVLWIGLLVLVCFAANWAGGTAPPGRTVDAMFWFFLLGWFPIAMILLRRIFGDVILEKVCTRPAWVLTSFVATFFILGATFNYSRAVRDVVRRASAYHRALDGRYAALQSARARGATEVAVPELFNPPPTLLVGDLAADPMEWQNKLVADYFDLKSVRVIPYRPTTMPD